MDEELRKGLKRIAKNAELKLAESLLRWKYKKEGRTILDDENIGEQSKLITDQAHQIVVKRGKNILDEFKQAYQKGQKKENSSD